MGFHSGPAMGVVAGNNIPNYCIMSDTGNLARFEVAILFLGRINCQGDGEDGRRDEDPHQLHLEGAA